MTLKEKPIVRSVNIESKILGILNKEGESEALLIASSIGLTYDTTAKYLKKMTEEGKIERKARGSFLYSDGRIKYPDKKKHWSYYYRLKNN